MTGALPVKLYRNHYCKKQHADTATSLAHLLSSNNSAHTGHSPALCLQNRQGFDQSPRSTPGQERLGPECECFKLHAQNQLHGTTHSPRELMVVLTCHCITATKKMLVSATQHSGEKAKRHCSMTPALVNYTVACSGISQKSRQATSNIKL